ncbi:MAG: substrate-binding domain-containing protein [Bifidobacteriaceae bacterium]|jgi:ABC-type xylose transport system substrate-binding protein|nr:substrate-binding domain-containing protein [Bifidobacteriaceae bacterium]
MTKKIIISLTIILLLVFLPSACSTNQTSQSQSIKEVLSKDKVALVYPKNAKDYFDSLAEMLKNKDFSVTTWTIDEFNSIKQDNIVKTLKDQNYRFLIIDVINRSQLNTSLDNLRGQGTNIIGYDNIVYNIGAPDANVTFDYVGYGMKAAEQFVKDNKINTLKAKNYKTVEFLAGNALLQSNYDYFKGVMKVLQPFIDNGEIKVLSKNMPTEDGNNISQIATINNNDYKLNKQLNDIESKNYKDKQLNGLILGPNISLSTKIKVYNTNRDKNKYLKINEYVISLVLALKNHANIDEIQKVSNNKRMIPTVYVY